MMSDKVSEQLSNLTNGSVFSTHWLLSDWGSPKAICATTGYLSAFNQKRVSNKQGWGLGEVS